MRGSSSMSIKTPEQKKAYRMRKLQDAKNLAITTVVCAAAGPFTGVTWLVVPCSAFQCLLNLADAIPSKDDNKATEEIFI